MIRGPSLAAAGAGKSDSMNVVQRTQAITRRMFGISDLIIPPPDLSISGSMIYFVLRLIGVRQIKPALLTRQSNHYLWHLIIRYFEKTPAKADEGVFETEFADSWYKRIATVAGSEDQLVGCARREINISFLIWRQQLLRFLPA